MSNPQAVLGDQVRALLGVERAIDDAVGEQFELTQAHPELHTTLAAIQARCAAQGQELEHYLREHDLDVTGAPSPIVPLLAVDLSPGMLAQVLCADAAALAFAASGYAVLMELSLRLYDPVLRGLAPEHLAAHTKAVVLLNHLLPRVVVNDLDRQEMDCRCICPMCSLGACGCTTTGRAGVSEVWRTAALQPDDQPGLEITSPRRGSQLADHAVRGGDRLVAIDGQPITASGIGAVMEIQAAIRKHDLGDELLLAISRGTEEPCELRVKHAGDYPSQ